MLTSPGGWVAIGSLIVLSFIGLCGRKIKQRNKLTHHIYKSMVTIYDVPQKTTQDSNKKWIIFPVQSSKC